MWYSNVSTTHQILTAPITSSSCCKQPNQSWRRSHTVQSRKTRFIQGAGAGNQRLKEILTLRSIQYRKWQLKNVGNVFTMKNCQLLQINFHKNTGYMSTDFIDFMFLTHFLGQVLHIFTTLTMYLFYKALYISHYNITMIQYITGDINLLYNIEPYRTASARRCTFLLVSA